jgi:hypothetical protein
MKTQDTTLREFLALFCADIDIFLLQDEAQEKDLDKFYSKEEIREQLHKTMDKFTTKLGVQSPIYDMPLFSTLSIEYLKKIDFSQREINQITNK